MGLLRQLWVRPVEVLGGILLVVVGIVLTVSGSGDTPLSTRDLILGGLSTAFGGILLSWTAGKVMSKSEALDEVRSQLDLVSRNLGQASGQISRAVEQAQSRQLHPATGFALVSQAAMMIYAQVTAIQNIIGDKFDSADLLATVTELESLAVRLEQKGALDTEVDEVRERLLAMRTVLSRGTVSRAKALEKVPCPSCGTLTDVRIGVSGGETAAVTCAVCLARFNLHRRPDSSLFTRLISGVGLVPTSGSTAVHPRPNQGPRVGQRLVTLDGPCPSCDERITLSARVTPGEESRRAVCTSCGGSISFDLTTQETSLVGQLKKVNGVIVSRYGSGGSGARPVVSCSSCGRQLRCIIRKSHAHYAVDEPCGLLFEVDNASFAAWRSINDPTPTVVGDAVGEAAVVGFDDPPTIT